MARITPAQPRHRMDAQTRPRTRRRFMVALVAALSLIATLFAPSVAMATGGGKGKDPSQNVTCEFISGDYHRPLTNGDHINVDISPTGKQVNMYVDQNIAGGASYNGQNNLGLRWKILGVEQTPIPLTLEQVKSGVITFNYGAELKKLGINSWTVAFVQTNSTDTWPKLKCGEEPPVTPKDATASFEVKKGATCDAPSKVKFNLVNATLDTEPATTPGEHSVTATANEGHLFGDGTSKMTLTYMIDPQLPADSPECYVPPVVIDNNPQYSVSPVCGGYTAAFNNPVELGENQTAPDAEFIYTDENGETQTVTVPVNETRSITVNFPEDSGEHTVKVGIKGKTPQQVVIDTDCVVNPPEYFTPPILVYQESCKVEERMVNVPGFGLVERKLSHIDPETGIVYYVSADEVKVEGVGTYYVTYQLDGETLTSKTVLVPSDYVVPKDPEEVDGDYVIEDGHATWYHTFTSEKCAVTPPGPTPSPSPSESVKPSPSPSPSVATVGKTTPKPPTAAKPAQPALAATGMAVGTGLALALALMVGGYLLTRARKRRTPGGSHAA